MNTMPYKVQCPKCGHTTIFPVLGEIRAKAQEDWDLAEQSAQERLTNLDIWFWEASLLDFIKLWFKKEK